MEFLGPQAADAVRHIMVDGAARANTVLTLSHWPSSPTPPHLRRDLSCEIVMVYLEGIRKKRHFKGSIFYKNNIEYVTVDHLDEDGILSVLAVLQPEFALKNKNQLISAARLGDFNIASFAASDTLTFALRFLLDPKRTYLPDLGDVDSFVAKSFTILDELVKEFLSGKKVLQAEAEAEMAAFHRSYSAISTGVIELTEIPILSLSVVKVAKPENMEGSCLKADLDIGIHPAAIHTLTDMPRILLMYPDKVVYYDRYETWVRFISKKLPPRVNLELMAARLNSQEGDLIWHADSINEPIACFYAQEPDLSQMAPEKVKDFLCSCLLENTVHY